jgi:phage shock protein C
METKRLYRSTTDKMIGGVCAGLANYFGLDPTVVRLIFVFLFLLGGHGLLVYLILLLVIPPQPAS